MFLKTVARNLVALLRTIVRSDSSLRGVGLSGRAVVKVKEEPWRTRTPSYGEAVQCT